MPLPPPSDRRNVLEAIAREPAHAYRRPLMNVSSFVVMFSEEFSALSYCGAPRKAIETLRVMTAMVRNIWNQLDSTASVFFLHVMNLKICSIMLSKVSPCEAISNTSETGSSSSAASKHKIATKLSAARVTLLSTLTKGSSDLLSPYK
jgi:hypothetical protein